MNTINISVSSYSKEDGPSFIVKTVKVGEAASAWSALIAEAMDRGYVELKGKIPQNPYWRGIKQQGSEIAIELKLE